MKYVQQRWRQITAAVQSNNTNVTALRDRKGEEKGTRRRRERRKGQGELRRERRKREGKGRDDYKLQHYAY